MISFKKFLIYLLSFFTSIGPTVDMTGSLPLQLANESRLDRVALFVRHML